MSVCCAGEDLRLHSPRGYLGNPSLSTFRSPNSLRPERSLLSSLAASHQQGSDSPHGSAHNAGGGAGGGLNTILTTNSPRSYLQATAGSGNYSRNISFSDDSVTANASVDRRNRPPQQNQQQQQRSLPSPQQERQRRPSGSQDEGPSPRGILCQDSQFRYTAQPSSRPGHQQQQQQDTPSAGKSLPHRRHQPQQRQSPPPLLPLSPPDLSPLENRTGDDIYGVRGKVVNFSVADSYQMTPRRGNSSSRRLPESPRSQPRQSSRLGDGDGEEGGPLYANRTGHSSLGQPYSATDMDDVLGESTAATVDDEDRTTTTSGSYTINADDLCNEIDNLFFNDVVV